MFKNMKQRIKENGLLGAINTMEILIIIVVVAIIVGGATFILSGQLSELTQASEAGLEAAIEDAKDSWTPRP